MDHSLCLDTIKGDDALKAVVFTNVLLFCFFSLSPLQILKIEFGLVGKQRLRYFVSVSFTGLASTLIKLNDRIMEENDRCLKN